MNCLSEKKNIIINNNSLLYEMNITVFVFNNNDICWYD